MRKVLGTTAENTSTILLRNTTIDALRELSNYLNVLGLVQEIQPIPTIA